MVVVRRRPRPAAQRPSRSPKRRRRRRPRHDAGRRRPHVSTSSPPTTRNVYAALNASADRNGFTNEVGLRRHGDPYLEPRSPAWRGARSACWDGGDFDRVHVDVGQPGRRAQRRDDHRRAHHRLLLPARRERRHAHRHRRRSRSRPSTSRSAPSRAGFQPSIPNSVDARRHGRRRSTRGWPRSSAPPSRTQAPRASTWSATAGWPPPTSTSGAWRPTRASPRRTRCWTAT